MDVYLDIDGVLLANDKQPANHVHEFLEYITSRFPTFWLTTHCQGDASQAISRLDFLLDEKSIKLAKKINATNWIKAKTEAINFQNSFLWFDDDLYDEERQMLINNSALHNWIEVDLTNDENQLNRFVESFPKPVNLI